VVGLGLSGESHVRAYRSLPHAEVVAVGSRSAARAHEVAARYGIARAYGSYRELIADPAVQAVSVATAEHEHREPVELALAAGKHVLVEKPLATTLEDARAIADAAARSTAILMPGHILRFHPGYARLRAAAERDELGRLVSMTAKRNRTRALLERYGRVHPALVTAVHDVDAMQWIAGDRISRVTARDRLADRDGGAHGLWALVEFQGGAVGLIETSWMLPPSAGLVTDDRFEIVGTRSSAKLRLDGSSLQLWGEGGVELPDLGYEAELHGRSAGALKEQLSYFAARASAGSGPEVVSVDDGVAAVAVVLALIESARLGTTVDVCGPPRRAA
jgi:predicted dehydrogenase